MALMILIVFAVNFGQPTRLQAQTTHAATLTAGYDGGTAVNPSDLKGKRIRILNLPKLIGIPYFAATTKGIEQAVSELGNIDLITDAPLEPNVQQQIDIADKYITQGNIDGILFAANDPDAISPVLKKALSKGIHVIGFDADSQVDAREWFVLMANWDAVARAEVDNMVAQVGPEADVALITSSLTAPGQMHWIAEMKKYMAAKYPKLNLVIILPAEEDEQLAMQLTQVILKAYPNVKGIWGLSSVAFPGAVKAVSQAGLCGKIAVVGQSTPNQVKEFIKSGCIKNNILWNPVDLGYAAVYAMRAQVDGALLPGAMTLQAGHLGTLQIINGSEILLGDPFIFTKDNIDQFDF